MQSYKESQSYKEYFIYAADLTTLAAGSGSVFTDIELRTDSDADFEILKRSHVATDNRIKVRFKDDGYGRNYQNKDLDLRLVSGAPVSNIWFGDPVQCTGLLPFTLPTPVPIKAASNYTVSVADNSGNANSIRLALHGAKVRAGKAPWQSMWRAKPYFDYTFDPVTLVANGTATITIPTNIDSHFLIKKITGTMSGAALVTVKDGSTDRQWMDKAVHLRNFVGNAAFPNILPAPRFVRRGSVINLTLQDLSGAANQIQIVFCGDKLFE